ncbi:MAG: hypothetical protein F4138_06225 [Acidimicrobiia bacterium]|nr:hypothetical protein [Acidimicrobiia bacterium]MYC57370.1 hypothetical protein [Acidimicrobiia bacterium]MYG94573.1 hypothetical protein [Acidimicrobiia bacterium]MYI31144.1 hypothetical protein [Acidimicrobiia bacterium]
MNAVEVVVFTLGALVSVGTLLAAIQTVVVPRTERSFLIRFVYVGMGLLFSLLARRRKTYQARDALLARYAPITLMSLPLVWAAGVTYGFSLMFWGLDVRPYREALVLSGWSLTTLGYRITNDVLTLMLATAEALIGLGIVALLISFLPTMYSAFSSREVAVARLEIRAGTPPTPEAMIILAHENGALELMDQTWTEWEHWFIHIEETHQSYPALVYFRSVRADRSWVTAAGAVLDTAAIMLSTVAVPPSPAAPFVIRSGYVALRHIADFFAIDYNSDPAPSAPISVRRHEFYATYDKLKMVGVPLVQDREQAWRDFAGWRVNYDECLVALASITSAPPGKWSSDRPSPYHRLPLLRRPLRPTVPPVLRQLRVKSGGFRR